MSLDLEKQKDNAYWERNQLVAALSKLLPSHLAKHPDEDKEWEDDWRNIVVIYLPSDREVPTVFGDARNSLGARMKNEPWQLTWHIHDFELPNFDHLEYQDYFWDGHDTQEKYRRLRTLATQTKGKAQERDK